MRSAKTFRKSRRSRVPPRVAAVVHDQDRAHARADALGEGHPALLERLEVVVVHEVEDGVVGLDDLLLDPVDLLVDEEHGGLDDRLLAELRVLRGRLVRVVTQDAGRHRDGGQHAPVDQP